MTTNCATILVNFGGPRHLGEVAEFLEALLTDRDVIRTGLPQWAHNLLFKRIARRRANKVRHDYASIGGCSPIYEDTEKLAKELRKQLPGPILTFHRYLPATHTTFISRLYTTPADQFDVFPLFPQFTHATTGSTARWMHDHLPTKLVDKLQWVKSYPDQPPFVTAQISCIRNFLSEKQLADEEVFLLFSAHGIPKSFLRVGDTYPRECEASVAAIMMAFPQAKGVLAYQSKFGPGEWLRPYTSDVSRQIKQFANGRQHVVMVPISFTSDHIETLFEVEQEYLPPITAAGCHAYRCPALNLRSDWVTAIPEILASTARCSTEALILKRSQLFQIGRSTKLSEEMEAQGLVSDYS